MTQFLRQLILHLTWFCSAIVIIMVISLRNSEVQEVLLSPEAGHSGTAFRIPEFAENDTTHWDMIHLGSSTCYRSMDPHVFEEFDIRSFNLCSSSQTFFNSYFILKWALNKSPTIQVVTVDIQPDSWSGNGLESTRDFICNNDYVGNKEFMEMALLSMDPMNIILAQYFKWKRKGKAIQKKSITKETYRGLGFVESHLEPLTSLNCASRPRKMNFRNLVALRSIMSLCAERGIQLIFINPPVLCEPIWSLPREFEEIPLIDGMEWELASSLELHYDEVHLRGEGAFLFSKWLAPQLAEQLD